MIVKQLKWKVIFLTHEQDNAHNLCIVLSLWCTFKGENVFPDSTRTYIFKFNAAFFGGDTYNLSKITQYKLCIMVTTMSFTHSYQFWWPWWNFSKLVSKIQFSLSVTSVSFYFILSSSNTYMYDSYIHIDYITGVHYTFLICIVTCICRGNYSGNVAHFGLFKLKISKTFQTLHDHRIYWAVSIYSTLSFGDWLNFNLIRYYTVCGKSKAWSCVSP